MTNNDWILFTPVAIPSTTNGDLTKVRSNMDRKTVKCFILVTRDHSVSESTTSASCHQSSSFGE